MSASRARRRLMAKQRYERRCLLLAAAPSSASPLWNESTRRAYHAVERQCEGRWWRRPWMLRDPHRKDETS